MPPLPHRVRLYLILATLLLVVAAAHADINSFTNPGFETGDLSGWTTNLSGGTAQIVTAWYQEATNNVYVPVIGNYLLAVGGGSAGVGQLVYQDFTLNSGDGLTGWAAFNGRDFDPFIDSAAVRIYDSSLNLLATPWSEDISTVGDLASSDPVQWSWTAVTGGTYRLEYSARNDLDALSPSYGVFDAEQFDAEPVPEPGTLVLLLTGLPVALWLRRRR